MFSKLLIQPMPTKSEKNLQQDNDSKKPEDLAENEKTPFIDEQTRTDK